MNKLIDRLENYYDFQCEGGPLRNCVEWDELKRELSAAQATLAKFESAVMPEDLGDDLLKRVRALYNKTLAAHSCSTVDYPDRINAGLLEVYAYGRRIGAAAQTVRADENGRKYMELIYQVGNKYPNESRHETALRYIREREQSARGSSAKGVALAAGKEE